MAAIGISIHHCDKIHAEAHDLQANGGALHMRVGGWCEVISVFMPIDKARLIADAINAAEAKYDAQQKALEASHAH